MRQNWAAPVSVEAMYGDWDYEAAVEALGRSLSPRSNMSLFDTIGSLGIGEDDFLDIGGRDGRHCLLMAELFGCRGMSVDPVKANLVEGAQLVAEHENGHPVELRLGVIEEIPAENAVFDLVLSCDMLGHIEDLDRAFAERPRPLVRRCDGPSRGCRHSAVGTAGGTDALCLRCHLPRADVCPRL